MSQSRSARRKMNRRVRRSAKRGGRKSIRRSMRRKSMPGWLGMQINSAPSATTRVTYWLRGALQHEFEPARNMTASLAAAPGTKFIVVGAQPGENSAKVSGGFDVKVGRSVSLFGAVDALLGKTPASYNGQVGARIRF